jgi:hypothetical protein
VQAPLGRLVVAVQPAGQLVVVAVAAALRRALSQGDLAV